VIDRFFRRAEAADRAGLRGLQRAEEISVRNSSAFATVAGSTT
jgi:hypothetical protein